jgi:endonuclease VIII
VPEGDTIFRAARTLHRALAGHAVVRFESVSPALTRVHEDTPVTGRTIEAVSAAGKHLLMRFSGDLVLRTHMRMNGSWHIYRPGEAWQRPRRDMRVLVATRDFVAVGFNVPVAEFIEARRLARHRDLARLGPDLLADDFDEAEALARMRAQGARPIAEVLLDQRVVAGIGNVYKSEVLFVCGISPTAPVAELKDETLQRIISVGRRLLRANVQPGVRAMTTYSGLRRTTGRDNPQDRLWVYGRAGQPCRRCGTPIRMQKEGPAARLTYWCPRCQTR